MPICWPSRYEFAEDLRFFVEEYNAAGFAEPIPTPSMEDNLLVGDHLLVNKFAFGARGSILDAILPLKKIKRGDVIVLMPWRTS